NLDPILRLSSGEIPRRGKTRLLVAVLAVVARRMDYEHAFGVGVFHRLVHGRLLRREALPEAHVDDLRTDVRGVANGVRDVLVALIAIRDGADRDDFHGGCDAVDANAVATYRPDDARDVCAVLAVRTHHVGVAIETLSGVFRIVANDGTRVVRHAQTVLQSRRELRFRLGDVLRRDTVRGESQEDRARLLDVRPRRANGGDVRDGQRVGASRLAQDRKDLREDLIDLLNLRQCLFGLRLHLPVLPSIHIT